MNVTNLKSFSLDDSSPELERWFKLSVKIEFISIFLITAIELLNIFIMHFFSSDGYDSSQISYMILRYVLVTAAVNIAAFLLSYISFRKLNRATSAYMISIGFFIMVCNIVYNHYEFLPCLMIFAVPLFVGSMFEDYKLLSCMTILTFFGFSVSIMIQCFSGQQPILNVFCDLLFVFLFIAIMCFFSYVNVKTIQKRRAELLEKLELEQKSKYSDILTVERNSFKRLSEETFIAIAKAIDVNDAYTAGHSQRVANYSREIAKRMGMSGDDLWEVYYAALLHDVGKLGIDNTIINKTTKLNDDEYNEIKRHPLMGFDILKGISIKGKFALGAKCHHERWDGRGYPCGLSGTDIPLIGRIIAVADAYDAMTSKRAYRPIMPQINVRREIEAGIGKQFDPDIAKIMLNMIDEDDDYIMHQ